MWSSIICILMVLFSWLVCLGLVLFCFVLGDVCVWGALFHFISLQNQAGKSSLPITCFSYIYFFPYFPNTSVSFCTCKNFPSSSTAERRPKLLRSVQIASCKAILLLLWSLTSWQLFASGNLWSSAVPSVSLLPALLHCSLL